MKFLIKTLIFLFILNLQVRPQDSLSFDGKEDAYQAFEDVYKSAGIPDIGKLGHNSLWGDFNGDGCLDLFASNTDSRRALPNVFLFKNNCNGTFDAVTKFSGLPEKIHVVSSLIGDIDNDGFKDLILGDNSVYGKPHIFRNLGGSLNFAKIHNESGITEQAVTRSLVFVDYNKDGLLDLLKASTNSLLLYRNEGEFNFSEGSNVLGLSVSGNPYSIISFDYNNDSYPDVFVAGKGLNSLFENNGDGTFTDVSAVSGIQGSVKWKSVAACTGDINNDGYFDLYVVNIRSKRNALYLNNGDGTFSDITNESGTRDVGDGRTCSFVDYNSDGLLDLFSTNHVNPSKLYKNLGNNKFKDMAFNLGISKPIDAFTAVWGDFNGDAVLDVFLNGHIGMALYRGFNINKSFTIELVGDGINTNTSAIGSRVIVKSVSIDQVKEVSGGKGCCEQDMLPLQFGLGKENAFDLKIKWTSGATCSYNNLNVEDARIYKIWEKDCKVFSY